MRQAFAGAKAAYSARAYGSTNYLARHGAGCAGIMRVDSAHWIRELERDEEIDGAAVAILVIVATRAVPVRPEPAGAPR